MEEEELLGIGDYVAILKRRKFQLIIPAILILLISIGLALGLPSVYRAEATILIEQQEIPDELVRSTVTSYAGERIQVISQRVMTTENLVKIIDNYELYQDERNDTSLTQLAEKLHDDIELDMISADVVDPRSGRPTTATIAFTLSYINKDPRVSQKITNEIVSLYLDENLRQRTRSALETSSFLTSEANRLNNEINLLEGKLAQFKEEHVTNLPELQQLNIQLMERNEQELLNTVQQIRNLEERIIYLQSELAQMNPTSDLFNSSGERIIGAEDRLMTLKTEYLALTTRYTDDHPTVSKIKEEIELLEKKVTNSNGQDNKIKPDNPAYLQLATQLKAAESELESLNDAKDNLKVKLQDYENRLIQSPQVEKEYRNLTRDYDNALAKYQEIKAKQLEAELAESLERERKGERFSLIEPPQVPEMPHKPNRIAILLLGVMLSVIGSITYVAIVESLDETIYRIKDLVDITKAPPLAIIPYIELQEEAKQKMSPTNLVLISTTVLVPLILVTIHYGFKPLDVVWFIVLRKIGIESS
ncbi:MAG: lipopolysaccharide biosynthesis protein [Candidatus Thiodiazotropha endolucinida]|nr:lipopolysaccharide biosynthesis protein [Candidatus Thiodiazotropha taylori]MCG8053243.1 lipopolysaccharide biosynthesis protein [Candidatus Thiodiazotropha taylori]MCG8096259.1 lipopolysaccharide biosynthesis protein [Candidatus Thiodiazotropha endolucinida]MCW4315063.1 lipopolysaccharide biosynthesis protein [Candidatus Thiodiazotropha taylori]MCW4321132.1 lipopolysaccharide biosynthesis protein [Candidatus Thiodiazotropha taylori]